MPYKRKFSGGGYRARKSRAVRRRLFGPMPRPFQRRRRGTGYKGKARMMRSVAMSIAENKERQVATKFNSNAMNHNTLYNCQLHWSGQSSTAIPTNVPQGSNGDERNGKEIYSVGFRVRGVMTVPYDRRNVRVKIWLVAYNTLQGTVTTFNNWFLPNGSGDGMLDSIDTHRFPGVRLLRTLRVKARDLYIERGELTDSGSDASLYYDIWIPYRRKMTFQSSAQVTPFVTGGKELLSLVCLPYDTVSTLETDTVITSHEQQVTFYFRDP